jgi:hypothetical protein
MLAIGMIGVALVRAKAPHFVLHGLQMIGYSIADTALVSLISRYSPSNAQV